MKMFLIGIAIGLVIVAGCTYLGKRLGIAAWNWAEKKGYKMTIAPKKDENQTT